MRLKLSTTLFVVFFIIVNTLWAQGFGQNKIQYENFNWRYIQSEHFDVYFYDGGYDIARFTAEVAESAYVSLSHDFQYDLAERVSIITYKSHNDFQQTNVVYSFLTEGIGGVTELFKNRIILPYEGSYSQFRHVIHHELVHAVMNDMLYGGSIQSLITGQVAQVPLWFSEGIAEFESLRWDTKLDMVVRDATLTGYLPPIDFLDYFPYQGGASVFRYIAQTYGNEKIGEILNKIKGSFNFQSAFKSAIGIDFKELTEEWQRRMKREYWPDIADRKEPGEIAKALTDHREDNSYMNSSAAISPQGDRIVFLSNRDGKMSIYLMDVLEGKIIRKLIQGESDVNFEELHFLEPGFGWSPDGKKITLAAKAGNRDAIYIYDLDSGNYDQFEFELDGIFSTTWSPKGDEIAFVGNKDGASDIYLFSLETEEITNITNDVFSDSDPAWSPDGQQIAFTSDRGEYFNQKYSPSVFDMHKHEYENEDIYIINHDGSDMRRITDTKAIEGHAIFAPDGDNIAYVSERNGVSNIYLHNISANHSWPITNLITGAFQLSWDNTAQKMVFTSFYRGGWDIYLLKDPLNMDPVSLSDTEYFKRLKKGDDVYMAYSEERIKKAVGDTLDRGDKAPIVKDYSKYVFADMQRRTESRDDDITLDQSDYKSEDGEYKVNRYKIKFTPDLINGAAGYSTFFGLQGYTQILLSDMLGNHQIYVGTNLVFDLRNSNINVQYWYLPNRIDYGLGVFHISNFFRTWRDGLLRFRNFGASLLVSRPFSKFTRMDFNLTWFNVNMEYIERPDFPSDEVRTLMPSASLVHDQVEWGFTGPKHGTRASASVILSPKYAVNSIEFTTVKVDYRRYFELFNGYSFAFRLNAGTSLGRNPQKFFLGGVPNWINRVFKGDIRANIEDIYFSDFITPLRGAAYYEKVGNSFGLFNAEFRFPLIPYIQLGLPPIRLGNIQGIAFTDIGSAWDNSTFWNATYIGADGKKRFKDILMGYGVGTRIYFMGFLVRFDVAWRYDLASVSKPIYYWSFGADF